MRFTHVHFTHAIPGYWLTRADGSKVFSASGGELSDSGRALAHSFPCNCDKRLETRHLDISVRG